MNAKSTQHKGRPGLAARRAALRSLLSPALWALAGCHDAKPVLRVGSIVFPGYEFMFLARELGLLAAAEVRLVEMRSNTDVVAALSSGRLEAAALTMDEMLSARSGGMDLRAVLVFDVSIGADVVLAKPPIKRAQELKGKVIAIEEGAVGAVLFDALLTEHALDMDDVEKSPMTLGNSIAAYQDPKVDAIVTAEPWASRLEALGAVRVFDSAAVPNRIIDVLAVRADVLDAHHKALAHLVSAHFVALRRFQTDPYGMARHLAPRLGEAAGRVPSMYRGLKLPTVADNRAMLAPAGGLQQPLRALMAVMLRSGLLKQPLDLAEVLDLRCLPEA